MNRYVKALLTGLVAAMALAAAVGSASATRLSVSEQGFLIRWSPLTLQDNSGNRISCNVTLDGSFHSSTIVKTLNSLIGYINGATIAGTSGNGREAVCTGGSATVLRETLPWHTQYGGFTGTLPRIATVSLILIGASFRIDPEGIAPACLARTSATEPSRGIASVEAGGAITGLRADETARIKLSNGFGCELDQGFFSGTGTVENTANNARITIRLI